MKTLILILTFLFPLFAAAQVDTIAHAGSPKSIEEEIFDVVEEMPVYPGGDSARQKFIKDNLVYPDSAIKKEVQGMVILQFVVEPNGSVSNIKAVKSFDDDCAKEAIRVVSLMKWLPGKQRGKAVRTRVVMPIKFRLY